jgi:hypothetical protein
VSQRTLSRMVIIALVLTIGIVLAPAMRNRYRLHAVFPAAIRPIWETPETVTLYSLFPVVDEESLTKEERGGERFHHYLVLGKLRITDVGQQAALRRRVEERLVTAPDFRLTPSICTRPRHGLRLTRGGETLIVIPDFRCGELRVIYREQTTKHLLRFNDTPPIFDLLLSENAVPVSSLNP